MFDRIKQYALFELYNISHGSDVEKATDRCYGAVMFATNFGTKAGTAERDEIIKWWNEEMHPLLLKLQKNS